MSNVIPLLSTLPSSIAPADVELFDPPMCCPTGLCGPALDQTLLDVNEMVMALQRENLRVERYQMASNPNAFLGNAEDARRAATDRGLAKVRICLRYSSVES